MSKKHPIISITGSSGAGTSTAKVAFEHIFRREHLIPAVVEGDSFHRFDRAGFKVAAKEFEARDERLSHFSDKANRLDKLAGLFEEYGKTGSGERRLYIHSDEEGIPFKQPAGTFTPWKNIPEGSDLLFYEGLHGGYVPKDTDADANINVAKHTDLLIGIVPVVNLEWIQKIHRDTQMRGYASEVVVDTILQRMNDYVHHITPQFTHADINFQRVPLVDTSNPFIARDVPTPDESLLVIHFRDPAKWNVDFPYFLSMMPNSFMSRPNTIVVPATKMLFAMELILNPIIHRLMEDKKS
ncbi:MAG: phosphoribulokinase [Mariprofundaceae bacterium]|nr:phosphoribulokinase [Mariprofundaceae bacterium]